jgi:single-stranded-DNA-specific exonuclease
MTSPNKIWQLCDRTSNQNDEVIPGNAYGESLVPNQTQIVEQKISPIPNWLIERVGQYAAQVLWQRGWHTPESVEAFLDHKSYVPQSGDCFGIEMEAAIARIKLAYIKQEKVAIWGDFDADGITATAVLWDGFSEFFEPESLDKPGQLVYYIPNRFRESHGLSIQGIDILHKVHNCKLIISCDTGSTSLSQILYANQLGIDLIITDHHTLPSDRPPVVSIINPRYLASDHPLYHLSGVAVAYKLVESLYAAMPEIPKRPLENLLDLVAIGLVADLVELKGDCRYLAQIGIEQLKKKERAGVKFLLEQCKKSGDRPTDISFGIAPRINAISRIWGDASKCVTLLTSKNQKECQELAELAEQANIQRKALQKKLFDQVQKQIEMLDLSTTAIILLADPEWLGGILGLVAGQVASEYGRPVILCTIEDGIAKGSARSPAGIDLYSLVKKQEHLLLSFGGHPFAAGLSLRLENLELLRETLQQQFWQVYGQIPSPKIKIDLELTLNQIAGEEGETIGKELFDQLRSLEPYGMGNPAPKILIRNCQFIDVRHQKIKTKKGQKLEYLKTDFRISDRTAEMKGSWWDHYSYDIPEEECDAIVELIDNTYSRSYELRIVDLRKSNDNSLLILNSTIIPSTDFIHHPNSQLDSNSISLSDSLGYSLADSLGDSGRNNEDRSEGKKGIEQWQTLVGMVKYLNRTGKIGDTDQIKNRLDFADMRLWKIGLQALRECGWQLELTENRSDNCSDNNLAQLRVAIAETDILAESTWQFKPMVQRFIQANDEYLFRQRYLYSHSVHSAQ